MFKAVRDIVPTYLSDRIDMDFYVNGYNTGGSYMDLYLPTLRKRLIETVTSSWQNRHLRFLAFGQFLYEVMIISLLPENSTLKMGMDFCISSGIGWNRILCYICVTTLHDSYL